MITWLFPRRLVRDSGVSLVEFYLGHRLFEHQNISLDSALEIAKGTLGDSGEIWGWIAASPVRYFTATGRIEPPLLQFKKVAYYEGN